MAESGIVHGSHAPFAGALVITDVVDGAATGAPSDAPPQPVATSITPTAPATSNRILFTALRPWIPSLVLDAATVASVPFVQTQILLTVADRSIQLRLRARTDNVGPRAKFEAGTKDFPATLEVLDASGEHIVNQRGLQIPGAGFAGENRFWFLPMQMVFRDEGRHNFILSAGGATASVGLRIAFG